MSGSRPSSAASRPPSAESRKAWSTDASGMENPAFVGGMQPGYKPSCQTPSPTKLKHSQEKRHGGKSKKSNDAGCWAKFSRGIRSIWRTREMEDMSEDREKHVRTTLRELLVYVSFLITLCIVTFGMTDSNMYYYTKVMSELFLDSPFQPTLNTFRGIATQQDFFRFSRDVLMDSLYWETWYTNANVSDDELGYIYYENKLLGVPRIRQMRVRNDSCEVEHHFDGLIEDCYGKFDGGNEDKADFTTSISGNSIPRDGGTPSETAWRFQSASDLGSSSHRGSLATYHGGGYIQDLAHNKAASKEIVLDLADNIWLDRGSRVAFIDFTVYNANINLFCVVKLIVEFPATGGALPSWAFRTVKLIRYVTGMDYFVMACEGILVAFMVYYSIEEALEIKKHKLKYFTSFWNILDVLVILIVTTVLCFNVYRTVEVSGKLDSLLNDSNQHLDFDQLSYWQQIFNSAIAITVFLAWIKIFKYLSFNKTMTQLTSTLGRCAGDLSAFAVMFAIVFFAFAILGNSIFGSKLQEFSNFGDCIFTLFRIILGDFDFHALREANNVLGPLYFVLYVFFVFFILLNMFLAIINDTYSDVKAELALQKNEFEMTDYFKRGYEKMVSHLNLRRDKIMDLQQALKAADINKDDHLDFDEWRIELKGRGYAEAEIEATFAKFDIDGDRILDADEQRLMMDTLEGQKDSIDKDIEDAEGGVLPEDVVHDGLTKTPVNPADPVPKEEFRALCRRVDRMEESLGSIVAKIDGMLKGLEELERDKTMTRENTAENFLKALEASAATGGK